MKVRHVQRHGEEEIQLQMTPMIDVVFQLLIFFIMTFKIVAPEGDFPITMPLAAPSPGIPDPTQSPPITITMRSDSSGRLTNMQFGLVDLGTDFEALRIKVRETVGDDAGPGSGGEPPEVTLKCDYDLHYRYTMAAITRVAGYVEKKQIKPLINKIRFAPPPARPGG